MRIIKKKLRLRTICILIIILSGGLSLLTLIGGSFNKKSVETIERPGINKDRNVELEAVLDGEKYPIDLKLEGRKIGKDEALKNLEDAKDFLNRSVLGKNSDIENIRTDLYMPSYLESYGVHVDWESSDLERVSFDGQVLNEDLGEGEERLVKVVANLKLGELTKEVDYSFKIKAPNLSSKDRSMKDIEKELERSDKSSKESDRIELPREINGKSLTFYERGMNISPGIFLGLGLILCLMLFLRDKEKIKRLEKEREEELISDYSLLTCKLSIFYEAGMSILNSLQLILQDYLEKRQRRAIEKRFAYENLMECLKRINNGMGEAAAYVEYGGDCKVKEYRKLGNYLSDNIKKGSRNLGTLLENEVEDSFSRKKSLVKTKAEEAGTKMLFPMMIMLGIVMIIVMMPAMMSFWAER